MNRPRSNPLLHAAIAFFLGLTTCASTPGHITGCSTVAAGTDPVAFCRQREAYVCARVYQLDRDVDAHTACVGRIDAACAGFNWGPTCEPTQAALDACLDALVDGSRLSVPPNDLPECATICSGAGGGIDPEGI